MVVGAVAVLELTDQYTTRAEDNPASTLGHFFVPFAVIAEVAFGQFEETFARFDR